MRVKQESSGVRVCQLGRVVKIEWGGGGFKVGSRRWHSAPKPAGHVTYMDGQGRAWYSCTSPFSLLFATNTFAP